MQDEAGLVPCEHCGDRISFDEPAVWVDSAGMTTEAKFDTDPPDGQRLLHRYCYEAVQD